MILQIYIVLMGTVVRYELWLRAINLLPKAYGPMVYKPAQGLGVRHPSGVVPRELTGVSNRNLGHEQGRGTCA